MIEYALFAMAMLAGTAAAKHVVGERAGGALDAVATIVADGPHVARAQRRPTRRQETAPLASSAPSDEARSAKKKK